MFRIALSGILASLLAPSLIAHPVQAQPTRGLVAGPCVDAELPMIVRTPGRPILASAVRMGSSSAAGEGGRGASPRSWPS